MASLDSGISYIKICDFGMLKNFECSNLSNINLIIGKNGTGKTFLMKALYTAVKAIEEYRRGDDIRSINDILAEKLRWTFQTEKLGDIASKGKNGSLLFNFIFNNRSFGYKFTKETTSKLISVNYNFSEPREINSIFIPAKEVLSLYNIILKSREVDKAFGFDDTYYDLTKALRISPKRGKNYTTFANSRKKLTTIINGKVELDDNSNKWHYKVGNEKYAIGITSEGVKKIAILDRLLANGYLSKSSVIFIDELESALHPGAISDFIDILYDISENMNIQIFIASHSYFVIKKLCLIAMAENKSITCISLNDNRDTEINDLSKGMPNNSIIEESIRLYEEEISKVL